MPTSFFRPASPSRARSRVGRRPRGGAQINSRRKAAWSSLAGGALAHVTLVPCFCSLRARVSASAASGHRAHRLPLTFIASQKAIAPTRRHLKGTLLRSPSTFWLAVISNVTLTARRHRLCAPNPAEGILPYSQLTDIFDSDCCGKSDSPLALRLCRTNAMVSLGFPLRRL